MVQNRPISTSEIRDHYDQLSSLYDRWWGEHIHHGYWEKGDDEADRATAQEKLTRKLAGAAGIPPGAYVLDVGCGLGGSSIWLAKELQCRVHGITLSPVQARLATARAEAEGLGGMLNFEVIDANHLSFPPRSVEVVWSIECIEHLEDKKSFFETCANLLRPGGTLAFCSWLTEDRLDRTSAALVREICHGMLCPSLATMTDHLQWLQGARLQDITAHDISENVMQTWNRCARIIQRRELQAILRISTKGTRDFANAFPLMQKAYADGILHYGIFTARAPRADSPQ